MVRRILKYKLNGANTRKHEITISAVEITANEFEFMVFDSDGEEIESKQATTEAELLKALREVLPKYLQPMQKAFLTANLKQGSKYTLVYLNEFGFPVAQKIKFESLDFITYAQYNDAVKIICTPYKKRNKWQKFFYNSSLLIFEGWQDLDECMIYTKISENENCKTVISKYGCFDSQYIEDLEKIFKNPVMIYKKYDVGVNGKVYG